MTSLEQVLRERLIEVLQSKPSYGDSDRDVAALEGKQALAEDLLGIIDGHAQAGEQQQ